MSKQLQDTPTAVTRITGQKKISDHPAMSFTAVTTHKAMAEAFVKELLRASRQLIPDRELSVEEVVKICQLALQDKTDQSITMVGGRHLRARVADQVARAQRYQEPFSIIILNLKSLDQEEDYDSVVDTLRERMRQTDLLFLFKFRIALVLPHTDEPACTLLASRIQTLIQSCLVNMPKVDTVALTCPHADLIHVNDVLDWVENQLRA